jgi:FAD-dependent urate hydroxylase
MQMARPLSILVVGAGIGGLLASLELRRAGYDVRLYEQHHDLRPADAALVLWPNALKVLNALGLRERVAGLERGLEQFSVRSAEDELLREFDLDALMPRIGTAVCLVSRHEFHSALLQAMEMDRVHLGAECVGVEQDGSSVSIRLADGERATGHMLVGADGIHSAVRRYLFPESRAPYAGFGHWVSTIPNDNLLAPGTGVEYLGVGKRVSMLPLGDNRIYCAFASTMERGTLPPGGGWLQPLTELFGDWPAPVGQLLERLDDAQIKHTEVHYLKPLAQLSVGRATLVGDAAHASAATLGQGACLAIEDAVCLARALAATDLGVFDALRRYEGQRSARMQSLEASGDRLADNLYVGQAAVHQRADANVRATSLGDIFAHLEWVVKGGPFG